MKLPRLLSAPLLWRRHIKIQERIALALEDLLILQCRIHGFAGRPSDHTDDDESGLDALVATDASSWEAEQEDRRSGGSRAS